MDALITGLSRVCGVDATIGLLLERTAGLSPHVRGRYPMRGDPAGVRRFIPACAG